MSDRLWERAVAKEDQNGDPYWNCAECGCSWHHEDDAINCCEAEKEAKAAKASLAKREEKQLQQYDQCESHWKCNKCGICCEERSGSCEEHKERAIAQRPPSEEAIELFRRMLQKRIEAAFIMQPPASFMPAGAVTLVKIEDEAEEQTNNEDSNEGEKEDMFKRNEAVVELQVAKQTATDVVREGDKIIIPEGMSYDDAMKWLERKRKEDERTVGITQIIETFPFDGAYALQQALSHKYGWTDLVPTPGFFGPTPPQMVGVEVAPGRVVQVPWGRIALPNVEGYISTGVQVKDDRLVFVINGEVKAKHKDDVQVIADLTRKFVKERSIYKGQAVRVRWKKDAEGNSMFDIWDAPKFVDTTGVRSQELIFSDSVNRQIETSLFTPVKKTDLCRKHKIPLKRGVLLEGQYGTGKTLTAYVAARLCQENGWTFIYLDTVADLKPALYFAAQYQPAMIFAEDIDRVTDGERTHEMDAILNTIDGIEAKNSETIVVLTTNHVENINKAMLRPGRLDAVISVTPPDEKAVERLLRMYGRNLIAASEDLSKPSAKLAGQIPAVIREVVERAKLAALSAHDDISLTGEDISLAADGMLNHLSLLAEDEGEEATDLELFGAAIGERVGAALKVAVEDAVLDTEDVVKRPALNRSNGSAVPQ